MITSCRSGHSFLGRPSINSIADDDDDDTYQNKCYPEPNFVESSSTSLPKKLYSREIDFFIEQDVEGLTSCTESLGFESSEERIVGDDSHFKNGGDEIELYSSASASSGSHFGWRKKRLERKRWKEKKFPRPLPSLKQNGQRSFFLRPGSKDGRLELTEVGIERPSVFRAHREDGRLRLHIARDDTQDEDESEEENEEEEEEVAVEERVVAGGGGEWGFRRCHRTRQPPQRQHNLLAA